jgi:hypothetical protein
MRFSWKWAGALAALAALSLPAAAHEAVYTVVLNGPSESPANASAGSGTAVITFDLDLVTMRVQTSFADLVGNTTASHIHCCTTVPGTGTAMVATQTPFFVDFPIGVKSGTYDHTFDLTVPSSYNPAFITAHGGTVSAALNDFLAGIDAGEAYLNVHTNLFAAGEIRGFLVPSPVPEPASAVLLALGLAAIGTLARRRIVS